MKFFGWLSKILISTVLISTLSVLTAGYVVNLYVEEIVRQYQLPALGKKIQFSDIAARLFEGLNISKPKGDQAASSATLKGLDAIKDMGGTSGQVQGSDTNSVTEPNGQAGTSGSDSIHPTPDTSKDATKPAGAEPNAGKDDSVAVWGQVQQEGAGAGNNAEKDLVISTEEFAKKKDMLSSADKMKIFTLVVSKLSQDEVQHLSSLLEGGITVGEMKEVDQILQKYLKKEEYQQLLDVLGKY
jgi:hypothetical protein